MFLQKFLFINVDILCNNNHLYRPASVLKC